MKDPLAGSAWSEPGTVAGFVRSQPNPVLMDFAAEELTREGTRRVLDLGCGAGRNAMPLARQGWEVVGLDLSWPMLCAARSGARDAALATQVRVALARMDTLPVRDRSIDFVIAHGIWNLARSTAEFRRAVAEAARVAKPGAALFVFTFSRHTLSPEAPAVAGERFVFTQFSGQPMCFLTEDELVTELDRAGFAPDAALPLRELNRRPPDALASAGSAPVIYEGGFRRRST